MMNLKELASTWESNALGELTKHTFEVRLPLEDAAKISALSEMYPKRTKEQIISELLSAALVELETSFPYVQGSTVVTTDEEGDPVFEDVGPTPSYLALAKKHFSDMKGSSE